MTRNDLKNNETKVAPASLPFVLPASCWQRAVRTVTGKDAGYDNRLEGRRYYHGDFNKGKRR